MNVSWLVLLKRFWWAIPMAALLAYGIYQHVQYNNAVEGWEKTKTTLTEERTNWKMQVALAKKDSEKIDLQYQLNLSQAEQRYAKDALLVKPIILTNEKVVREYATTPAGQSVCLDADGVRLFKEARDRLLTGSAASAP